MELNLRLRKILNLMKNEQKSGLRTTFLSQNFFKFFLIRLIVFTVKVVRCTVYNSFFLARNTNELNFVGHLAVGGWVDTSKMSRVLLYLPFTTSSPPPLRSHDPHKLGQKIFITSIITIGFPVAYVI